MAVAVILTLRHKQTEMKYWSGSLGRREENGFPTQVLKGEAKPGGFLLLEDPYTFLTN